MSTMIGPSANILTGALLSYNNPVENVKTITFNSELSLGNSGSGTVNIDWTAAQKQVITLTGNCTFTFTAPLGATNIVLHLIQGSGGSFTVTWPTIKWVNKTAPTLSTAAAAEDIISLYYNGTSYYGSYAINMG